MDRPFTLPADQPVKQRIGWLRFAWQLPVVVLVYVIGNALPVLPAMVRHVMEGRSGVPELGSAITALTAIVGMALALATCWLLLRGEGRVREAFQLSAPASWRGTLAWALFGVGGTLAVFAIGGALVQAMGLPSPDSSLVMDLATESPAMFALWIVGVAWFAAGFGEELLWRGFLMDRLERLAGFSGRPWLALLVQAVLFGLPHAYQGWGGVVVTGLVGLLLGWIRLMQRGNLWAVILAHATVDTVMLSLGYAEKLGWISN